MKRRDLSNFSYILIKCVNFMSKMMACKLNNLDIIYQDLSNKTENCQ